MVSPPSEPHSEKAHPNSPPQINLAFKAKGPDQDPGATQPEGNSTHLTFFPGGGATRPWYPLDLPMACTGSFANVLTGVKFENIKLGQNFGLSKNGSWALVDACNFFLVIS